MCTDKFTESGDILSIVRELDEVHIENNECLSEDNTLMSEYTINK